MLARFAFGTLGIARVVCGRLVVQGGWPWHTAHSPPRHVPPHLVSPVHPLQSIINWVALFMFKAVRPFAQRHLLRIMAGGGGRWLTRQEDGMGQEQVHFCFSQSASAALGEASQLLT
jgi:hypothetical protein